MWYDPMHNYYAQHYYDINVRWCYSPLYSNMYQALIKEFTQKFLGWARLINANYMSAGSVNILVLDSTPREFYHNYLLKNHITFHQWVKKFDLANGLNVKFVSLDKENGIDQFTEELSQSASLLVFDPKASLFKHPKIYTELISLTSFYTDFCWFLGVTEEQTFQLPKEAQNILCSSRENSITEVFDCDQWKTLSKVFHFREYLNFLRDLKSPRYTNLKVQNLP